jgi:hypothetical protein
LRESADAEEKRSEDPEIFHVVLEDAEEYVRRQDPSSEGLFGVRGGFLLRFSSLAPEEAAGRGVVV